MNSENLSQFGSGQQVLASLAALSYRTGDLSDYLREIVLGVSLLIQSDWSIVTIIQGETGKVIASSLDMGAGDAGFSVHGTLAGEVIQTGKSLVVEDIRDRLPAAQLPDGYMCYMGIPLKTFNGDTIGTICSFLRQPRAFTTDEVSTVELFAERAATAIDNYRLYQRQAQFNQRLKAELTAYAEELQVSQAKAIAYERLAAIGEFTAIIVHEIRNPLTTVEMGLQYARKISSNDLDRERMNLAIEESHRLKQLLNEILMYAKPQDLQLAEIDLGEFLSGLWLQLQEIPEAIDRHLNLTITPARIAIFADRDKLKQVFLNLIKNACEAIAPDRVVSCQLILDPDRQRVSIDIHNGGDPIPPEILARLMTPFCSTKASGTGLGLAIVKRIITAHEGEISVDSNAGGTTVSLSLPLAR